MKKILLPVLVLIILLGACKKDNQKRNCKKPNLNGTCITDAAQLRTSVIGRWIWTERTYNGRKSTPCTLEHTQTHYLELLDDGTLLDHLDFNCPLVGKYQISDSSYFVSYLDTIYKNPYILGMVSVCNNYLVIDKTSTDKITDVYIKD